MLPSFVPYSILDVAQEVLGGSIIRECLAVITHEA